MATPTDGRPITQWPDRDQAMLEVANAIKHAAERFAASSRFSPPTSVRLQNTGSDALEPRSSNLRLTKTFTDRDKDKFKIEAFDYMAKFFENSLDEMAKRNPGVEGVFRRIDGNRFTAAIYRNGKTVSRCTVFMGGGYNRRHSHPLRRHPQDMHKT